MNEVPGGGGGTECSLVGKGPNVIFCSESYSVPAYILL
jgi:hypothetical protein